MEIPMNALARITIVQGDITSEKVDAIVNAANTDLLLGAGVAGAIRSRGGSSIQLECNRHGPVELGGAALTGGGDLPARYVIHAAAMHLGGSTTAESIAKAVLSSLRIAEREQLGTVSFPALGTGIGGFPMDEAARIMLRETIAFLNDNEHPENVRFVLFDEQAFRVFKNVLDMEFNGD